MRWFMLYNTQEFKWITLFFVYSILGWIFESCYVSLKMGKWTNRGFMKGPYLPIYGTGAVMMLVISKPFKDNLFLTFIAGVIGATLLELIVGIAIEHIFKVRYWDYSYKKFHYKGYICLSSSIAWGFFTIILNKWLHPAVESGLKLIPQTTGEILFAGVFIIFSVDLVLSVREAMDMRNILIRMEAVRHEVQEIKKRADKRAEEYFAVLDDSLREMKEEIGAQHAEVGRAIEEQQAEFTRKLEGLDEARRALESEIFHMRQRILGNPTMTSKKYGLSLDILKGSIVLDKGNNDKEDVDESVS
jgi:uncharacterized membrane protein